MMLGKVLARGAAATQRQVALAARRPRGGVAAVSLGEASSNAAATPASATAAATAGLRRHLSTADESGSDATTADLRQGIQGQQQQQQQQQWQHAAASPGGAGNPRAHEEMDEEGGRETRQSWRRENSGWKPDNSRSSRGGGGWDRHARGEGGGHDRAHGRDGHSRQRGTHRPSRSKASTQYFEAVQEMRRTGSWNGVIEAYQRACDDESVEFTSPMLNITIAALARSPKWQVSLSILQEMREAQEITPDTYTFNAALMACVRGRQGKLAFALLREMQEVGVSPDSFTYSHLISVCGYEGKWEKALSLIEEMAEAGIKPNCVAYNGVIIACGNAGEADQAVAVLGRMRDDGVAVTEGSYSAAIAACGKNGKWERALELMEEMKEGRDNLEPNEYCYNSAISACERAARWQEAVALLREMQEEQLIVTTGTYTHVVKACTNAGEITQARDLLTEMRANGMHVKRATVAMVEKRADSRGSRDRRSQEHTTRPPASAVYTSGDADGRWSPQAAGGDGAEFSPPRSASGTVETREDDDFCPAPAGPFSADAGADAGRSVSFSSSPRQNPSITTTATGSASSSPPSTRVRNVKQFLLAIGSHSRNRRWAEIVADLHAAIADPRTKVSMRMYEGCLYGLASGGKWVEALAVLEKMQALGLKPNSSCVTGAIKACGKANPPKWGLALSLLRGLEEPEVWAYVAAFTALAKGGQWKASESLMTEMKANGVEPNLYCYNALLEACRLAEPPQWQHACSVLAQMKQNEAMPPNDVCYKTVVLACQAASETAVADALLSEMVEAGFTLQAEELQKKASPPVAECASP